MLKQQITPRDAGVFLSDLAEAVLEVTLSSIHADLTKQYPPLKEATFAIVGFGKLGAREMSFGSDLDMVFLYDDKGDDLELRAQVHRLAQRLVSALTLMMREGRLYEVDTRLRPGGADGPLATSISGFNKYFTDAAWTFELQALTKARVVASNNAAFTTQLEGVVATHICAKRNPEALLKDISDMRLRIANEHGTRNPWAVKYVRGGIVDCEFIAQLLVLTYAHTHPTLWHQDSAQIFKNAQALALAEDMHVSPLIEARDFLSDLLSVSRLMSDDVLTDDTMSAGLKRTLVSLMGEESFESLKERLIQHLENVKRIYAILIPSNA
jgi:[glutamine synthetase] adenylyltransferase / [glutamine synthetase]-adenylyl-L-tyrosine phosphorylase